MVRLCCRRGACPARLGSVSMSRGRRKGRPNAPRISRFLRGFQRAQALEHHFAKRRGIFAHHHRRKLRPLRCVSGEIGAVYFVEHARAFGSRSRFFRFGKYFAIRGRFLLCALRALPQRARLRAALRIVHRLGQPSGRFGQHGHSCLCTFCLLLAQTRDGCALFLGSVGFQPTVLTLLQGVRRRSWRRGARDPTILQLRLNLQNLFVCQQKQIVRMSLTIGARTVACYYALVCGLHYFPLDFGVSGCELAALAVPTAKLMARKCASVCARTLAKPAGLVIFADWPASEFAQRLHSSNSTAWSSRS